MLVVKIGGSVIQKSLTEVNEDIFECLRKLIDLGEDMVVVTGGGKICRLFQGALSAHGFSNTNNLHWTGTRAVNLQSEFIRSLLPENSSYPRLIDSEAVLSDAIKQSSHYKYFAAGGWEIGHSSDFDAVKMAIRFGSRQIIRISDIDYVYSADPKKDKNAVLLKQVSWEEYFSIIGEREGFDPGASFPVDPVAAHLARENGIKFYFTSLPKFLSQEIAAIGTERFDGTVIG